MLQICAEGGSLIGLFKLCGHPSHPSHLETEFLEDLLLSMLTHLLQPLVLGIQLLQLHTTAVGGEGEGHEVRNGLTSRSTIHSMGHAH